MQRPTEPNTIPNEYPIHWSHFQPTLSPKKIRRGLVSPADHRLLIWSMEKAVSLQTESLPVLVEIGTHLAGTTRAMCEALELTTDRWLWRTVDLHYWNSKPDGSGGFYPIDKFRSVKQGFREKAVRDKMQMIEGAGADRHVLCKVEDPVVWCFLDGCHCRECVEAELAVWAPRIELGGFLLLHDCTEDYRGYPPDQFYHGEPARPFAVLEVIEEWEKEHPEFLHLTTTPSKRRGVGKFLGGMRVLRRVV